MDGVTSNVGVDLAAERIATLDETTADRFHLFFRHRVRDEEIPVEAVGGIEIEGGIGNEVVDFGDEPSRIRADNGDARSMVADGGRNGIERIEEKVGKHRFHRSKALHRAPGGGKKFLERRLIVVDQIESVAQADAPSRQGIRKILYGSSGTGFPSGSS